MKSHEQLFILIHSLNPTEKRHLKIEAEKGGGKAESQYMELFRVLEALEVYDQEAVRRAFEGQAFLKHLSVAKAYLTDVILRSLRTYHSERLPALKTSRMVGEVEVLLEKGQVAMAERWVKKGKKLGEKLGDMQMLLQLCQLQRRIAKRRPGKNLAHELAALDAQELDRLEQYRIQLRIRQIHDRFYATRMQIAGKASAAELRPLLPELADPALQIPDEQLDPASRLAKAGIYAMYHRLQGQQESVLEWYRKVVELWGQFPEKRDLEPHLYLKSLLDYLDQCIELGAHEQFRAYIGKVRVVKVRSPKEKARRFILSYHLQLRHHLNTKDFVAAAHLGPGIEKGLQKNRRHITATVRLTFAYNLLVMHFLLGQHRDALHWSELIADTPWSKTRTDIRLAGALLRWVTLFQTGEYELLEKEMRRMRHGLAAESGLATALAKGLERLMEQPKAEEFAALQAELESVAAFEELGGGEIRAWLKSQTEKGRVRDYI